MVRLRMASPSGLEGLALVPRGRPRLEARRVADAFAQTHGMVGVHVSGGLLEAEPACLVVTLLVAALQLGGKEGGRGVGVEAAQQCGLFGGPSPAPGFHAATPVLPKPPAPRTVSDSSSTSTSATRGA